MFILDVEIKNTIQKLLALILITAGVFVFASRSTAQSNFNEEINYQGKLTDSTGATVPDGTYNMRFWLLTSGSIATTSAEWTESLTGSNRVQVTSGLFSVMLGSTSPLTSVDFNQTLYLGVEIGGTTTSPVWDGEMSPRKVLGAVPAAFEARQLGGASSTQYLRSDVANSATALLSFLGGASTTDMVVSGTTTMTTLDIGGEQYTTISDGAGSGLTNIGGVLTANISESNLNIAGGPTDGYVLQASSTVAGGFVWQATSSLGINGTADDLSDNLLADLSDVGAASVTGSLLYFDGVDWDDIATSSLNINTDNLVEGSNLFYTDTRVASYINGSSTILNTTTEAGLESFLTDVTDVLTNNDTISGSQLGLTNGYVFRGGAGNTAEATSTLFIADDGNVGIATTSPASTLDVWGDLRVGTSSDATMFVDASANQVMFGTTTALGSGANTVYFEDSTLLFRNTNSAHVSELAVSSSGSLDFVNPAGSATLFYTSSGETLRVGGNGVFVNLVGSAAADFTASGDTDAYALRVDASSDFVGVGTSTPTHKFSVAGDMHATGALYDNANSAGTNGMVLQSDGSGFNWVATSSLGFKESLFTDGGNTTYLTSLTDHLSVGTTTSLGLFTVATSSATTSLSIAQYGTGDSFNVFDGNTEVFTILDGGNVGIGRTTAGYKLDVFGAGRFTRSDNNHFSQGALTLYRERVDNVDPNADFGVGMTFVLEGDADDSTPAAGGISVSWENNQTNDTTDRDSTMSFYTMRDNAEQFDAMVLTSDGYLGIGTSSPASTLDVWGDFRVGTSATPALFANPANGFVGVNAVAPSGSQGYSFTANGGIYLTGGGMEVAGTNKIFGTNTGTDTGMSFPASNTVLFESSNSDVLRMSNAAGVIFNGENGAAQDFRIEADIIDDLFFADAGTQLVGIATDTPAYTLTVDGDIMATGALYDNSYSAGTNGMVLQTTGSGFQWVATSTLGLGGSAETNSLETTITGIADTEIFVGNGADSGTFVAISGDATLANNGALTLAATNNNLTTLANVTTVGTIGTGVWQGTAVADAYVADDITISASGTIDPQAITLATGNILVGDGSNNAIATSSLYIDTNQYVGIGTTSPASTLDVWGDLRAGTNAAPTLFVDASSQEVGIGTNNPEQRLHVSGGNILLENNRYFYIDDQAGIGRTAMYVNTFDDFHVGSTAYDDLYLEVGGHNSAVVIKDGTGFVGIGDFTGDAHLEVSANGGSSGAAFMVSSNDDNDGDLFIINEDGTVGVGTSSPASTLDVWGDFRVGTGSTPILLADTAANQLMFGTTTPYGTGGVYFEDTSLYFRNTSSANVPSMSVDSFGLLELNAPAGSAVIMNTSSGETLRAGGNGVFVNLLGSPSIDFTAAGDTDDYALRVDASSDFVGVGTSTPAFKFSVAGDTYITGALRDNSASAGTNGMVLQTTGSGFQWVATSSLGISGGSSLFTDGGATTYLTSLVDNLSVGTTSSQGLFTVATSSSATVLAVTQYGAGDLLNVFDGNSEVFTILDGGNVGIGTTTPGNTFSVVGSSYLDGTIALDGVTRHYDTAYFGSGNESYINIQGRARFASGNESGPSYSFNNDTDTGMYGAAGGTAVAWTVGGNTVMMSDYSENIGIGTTSPASKLDVWGDARFGTSSTAVLHVNTGSEQVLFGDGSTSNPSISFGSDTDTGFFRAGSNAVYYTAAGANALRFGNDKLSFFSSGSVSNPNVAIVGDGNTGLYFDGADRVALGAGGVEQLMVTSNGVGIGSTSPDALLSMSTSTVSGGATAGIHQHFSFGNSVENAVQYGNRTYYDASANTATTTMVGGIIRLEDGTTFGNTVRGFEVQANRGGNTQGENTALSGFARTFGVRGYSSGDAGGSYEPAGGFFETGGTTQGNAIRGYSSSITTAELLSLFQDTSEFTGTGMLMNFGNSGGSFAATSSAKFVDFQQAGTSMFTVTANGTTTIGDGTTNNQAGLQIGYGGLCVDNDGSCTASTTGRISSVSSYTGNSDLAEMYFSSQDLVPGEIVVSDGFLSVTRATGEVGERVLGVVSTKPGLLLGYDDSSLIAGQQGFPLALSGRVPVRLSDENGDIAVGDALTLSSIPGVAMKAADADLIVGYALESFDGENAYTEGFVDQFGDDIAKPHYEAINTNTTEDVKAQDGCFYGGGTATGEEEKVCEDEVEILETMEDAAERLEREAQRRYEAEQRALQALLDEPADTVFVNGESVKVGQVIMFVETGYQLANAQLDVLNELTSTSTELVLGAEEGSDETLWDRLKTLAQGFVDGTLALVGVKAEKIETNELCVDGVCVDANDLRALLDLAENGVANGTTTAPTETTEGEEENGVNENGVENTGENNDENEGGSGDTTETGTSTEPVATSTPPTVLDQGTSTEETTTETEAGDSAEEDVSEPDVSESETTDVQTTSDTTEEDGGVATADGNGNTNEDVAENGEPEPDISDVEPVVEEEPEPVSAEDSEPEPATTE